jgi:hypothetical protein
MEKQIVNGERIGAATRPVASQPRTRSAATPAPAAVQREIPGAEVTAIGDSVMAASAMALEAVLPGIYIDARPSRQMPAGLSVVRKLRNSGQLRAVVVVGLGTNYIEWSKEVNATMAAFVHRHPAVVLADWFDTIRHRMYLLWPDQVHPLVLGTRTYARMVYRAVQATRETLAAMPGHGL